MKILILGAYGFLGKYLSTELNKYQLIRQGRNKNSQLFIKKITSDEVKKICEKNKIELIINLTANTNVDECEKNYKKAYIDNVETVSEIIKGIKLYKSKKKPFLIHISTDQVYRGVGPHKEKQTYPINNYAKTKLLAEKLCLKNKSLVLRTNFIGMSYSKRKSLSDWIIGSMRAKKKINVYENVYFSPLYIKTLCKIINKIKTKKISGIFNLGSKKGMSKQKFAEMLCNKLNFDKSCLIKKSFFSNNQETNRPLDMRLDNSLFEKKFKIILPNMRSEVFKLVHDYKYNLNKIYEKI